MDDNTGNAVGIYFITMGMIILFGSIIASIFTDVSVKFPLGLFALGFLLIYLFGGLSKKKKSKVINKMNKPETSIEKLNNADYKEINKEAMQLFDDIESK